MSKQDFSTSFHVAEAPDTVFETILDVRSWWSGLYGEQIQDEQDGGFSFRAGEGAHYSRQKCVEVVPGQKIVWLVTESKLTFVSNQQEWTGTKIGFELKPDGGGTKVTFTHSGLVPQFECYNGCSSAWQRYMLERLQPLLNSSTTTA